MKKLVILALWAVICHTGIAAAEQTADVDAAEGPFPLTLADSIAMIFSLVATVALSILAREKPDVVSARMTSLAESIPAYSAKPL